MKARMIPFLGLVLVLSSLMFIASSAETVQVTPLPPVESTDGRAGICYSYYPDPLDGTGRPFIPLARDAGSRWERFDFAWPSIEPENGIWNLDPHADIVEDLQDGGITNIVGILQMTPQWAVSECTAHTEAKIPVQGLTPYPPGPGAFVTSVSPQDSWGDPWPKIPPRGLYQEWNDWDEEQQDGDPANYWGRFVYHAVEHYSSLGVMHWEMWNEAEWDLFWCGSEADYARLLEVGYRATKAACSECTVLFAGLHYWDDPTFFERVLDVLNDIPGASTHNYFFDAMSVHLYSRSSDVYDLVKHIRSRMNNYVSEHPIWLTETGVPIRDDSYGWVPGLPEGNWRATVDEAASYILQSYANAWAADVERYFLFRAHDDWCDKDHDGDCDGSGGDGGMTEIFGLIRDDRSLRPTYPAYQVATSYLVSPTMVTNWTYSNGARRVTLWGTPYGKISVLWNTTSETLYFGYGSTLPAATLVDQTGSTETISAADGEYSIMLEGATAKEESSLDYYIGGEPYLVIEEDTTPPSTATVHPLPSTTYSHTIPVSWEATDGEAGIWGFEVQVRRGSGSWTDWLSLAATVGADRAEYADGEDGETYCFRARAWDRTGNLGPWSDGESCTTLVAARNVTINVESVFGDANGDGTQSSGNEPTLTNVSFRLVDEGGQDAVTPASGESWSFSGTLPLMDYVLLIAAADWPSPPPGWLPRRLPVSVGGDAEPLIIEFDGPVGLLPHRASSYLPQVGADG